jgi:hypothetical protein
LAAGTAKGGRGAKHARFGVDVIRPYDWSNTTVANILEDEVYLGHTISLQSTTISYKNKKRIDRPKSEQLRKPKK